MSSPIHFIHKFSFTESLVRQLKDSVQHGTASDTELTILQTLKLILIEVIQVSDDRADFIKERAAASSQPETTQPQQQGREKERACVPM